MLWVVPLGNPYITRLPDNSAHNNTLPSINAIVVAKILETI